MVYGFRIFSPWSAGSFAMACSNAKQQDRACGGEELSLWWPGNRERERERKGPETSYNSTQGHTPKNPLHSTRSYSFYYLPIAIMIQSLPKSHTSEHWCIDDQAFNTWHLGTFQIQTTIILLPSLFGKTQKIARKVFSDTAFLRVA